MLPMLVRVAVAIVLWLLPGALGAQAEQRLALLIGNQRYSSKIGPLKNPHADIALIGAALRSLGFMVTEIKDANYKAIDTAIKRHIEPCDAKARAPSVSSTIPVTVPPIPKPRSTI
jgi:caspase domain-containing protein